ncbi:hypothetical protein HI914_06548 [Erysiphe necator]|nr:hypothetical protein HI914_06548 [Erysiphe necator]
MSSGYSHTNRQLKLKDTCDICSSSKVRCDKQKPTCGRCERLGQPCLYSPARRIGRPSSVRGPRNIKPSTQSTRDCQQQHFTDPIPPDFKSEDTSFLGGIKLPLTLGTCSEITRQNNEHSRISQERHSSVSKKCAQECAIVRENSLEKQVDLSEDLLISTPSLSLCGTDSYSICQTQNLHSNHRNGAIPVDFQDADNNSVKASSKSFDCAVIAIKLLAQLEMMSQKLESDPTNENYTQIQSCDAMIGIVTASLTPLSTILICSCSKNLEVAFLVSSALLAVLDILVFIIKRLSHHSRQNSNVVSTTPFEKIKDSLESQRDYPHISTPKDLISSLHSKLMKELPKVAKIVSLFPNLIDDGDEEYKSSELLLALAADVKSKFQCLASRIADW